MITAGLRLGRLLLLLIGKKKKKLILAAKSAHYVTLEDEMMGMNRNVYDYDSECFFMLTIVNPTAFFYIGINVQLNIMTLVHLYQCSEI